MSTQPAGALLHPRNRHQGRYDFAALIAVEPRLKAFMIINPYGKESIDFANPAAVRVFNAALLHQLYGIKNWRIPEGYLCPPVPGRADYIHGLADLLAADTGGKIPRGRGFTALDVGTGANCIYPLLGHHDYGWRFIASDIDAQALASAAATLAANGLETLIELRVQSDKSAFFKGVLRADERVICTLCNPPFHSSAAEASSGSERKWRNLGKQDPQRRLPTLNFGGKSNELWCKGGELTFVRNMIKESKDYAGQVLWFTTLVSKSAHIRLLQRVLTQVGALDVQVCCMAQGQKQSRFLAWTFHAAEQRKAWLADTE
ncbi:MAG: 23S rRNA (adenine(1618)-N(6))-methyltransferase RlmF [Gammaproteobacteria bacterium]|jgi:23S rRNA (adenine1618-N6)-methyltransferase|nr:23S rRNA (adenine(1618)-N(6))-methyltransferase RlmF [Pseudomonas sp.]NLO54700.1 23S rRNA (adenine(1618)-N(6))-methyltransferase RlmF [Gammaproteobacteria bacterium]